MCLIPVARKGALTTLRTMPRGPRLHRAYPDDESWRFQFPDGFDREVRSLLDKRLTHSSWAVVDCGAPSEHDRRTLTVVLGRSGRRPVEATVEAEDFVDPKTDGGDLPAIRYAGAATAVADAVLRLVAE